MYADVDRLIVGEDAGLECKTVSAYHADKWKDGAIPEHYLIQCFHYMIVTGKRAWYIAAVILGQGFVFKDPLGFGICGAADSPRRRFLEPSCPSEKNSKSQWIGIL